MKVFYHSIFFQKTERSDSIIRHFSFEDSAMPLLNFIPTPTWRDLIDILFLTLVAYQLYEWFRETRALRVLIGLVVLGGIYSVAKLWGLFLTTWVFQILWQVLLILLLILFQSEIRQVLEKVSPLRYLRSRRRDFHCQLDRGPV
jgi:DNA integrity scanning protein DisA with diadenylate cyclase activity